MIAPDVKAKISFAFWASVRWQHKVVKISNRGSFQFNKKWSGPEHLTTGCRYGAREEI